MGEIARRTAKTVTNADGSVTNITYHTVGGSPFGESRVTTLNGAVVSTVEIQYVYDASGTAYGISAFVTDAENNTTQYDYYYMHNLQGDVIGLWHQYLGAVCYYTYDAWGKLLSVTDASGNAITDQSHIAHINPIRYRGYYYDTESGLYYLQSRYYDPEVGRFVNGDVLIDQSSIVGHNLFAYCGNNPIMFSDVTGWCAVAWAAGYQGPCPGQGLPGCMDNWPQFQGKTIIFLHINNKEPPNHPDYIPPKNNNNQKVKNPNGKGYGWPAKDGGVWVYTPKMHGGEGWTVQYPGGDHSHAYPNGRVRNHFQREQTLGVSVLMLLGGGIVSAFLLFDNLLGFGVADDPLLVGSTGSLVAGLSGIRGKQVCTECGAVKYGY